MNFLLPLFVTVFAGIQSLPAQNFSLDTPLESRLRIAAKEEVWGTDWQTIFLEGRVFSKISPWLGFLWSGWSDWSSCQMIVGSDKLLPNTRGYTLYSVTGNVRDVVVCWEILPGRLRVSW